MSEKDWLIVEGAVRRGWNPEAVNALARLREAQERLEKTAWELRERWDAETDRAIAAETRETT